MHDQDRQTTARAARRMIRCGLKGALATQEAATGTPYASMVLLATDAGCAPITLISTLARHTRNLVTEPAASLLIDLSNVAGDADSGGRISLLGRFERVDASAAKARFLARHPAAMGYAEFADFGFFRFAALSAHMIEGFGRIVPLSSADLAAPAVIAWGSPDAEALALADLKQRWPAVTGLDADGVDLRRGARVDRLDFETLIADPGQAIDAARRCLGSATPLGAVS